MAKTNHARKRKAKAKRISANAPPIVPNEIGANRRTPQQPAKTAIASLEDRGAYSRTVDTRKAHTGYKRHVAASKEAGHALGRAHLDGHISHAEMLTGQSFAELLEAWAGSIEAPAPTAQAFDPDRVTGHDQSEEDVGRTKRLNASVDRDRQIIRSVDRDGSVWKELQAVCWMDRPCTNPRALKAGLAALANGKAE